MPPPADSFFDAVSSAQKLLVLDLGFLGDTIHLLPALHCIRRALPTCRLEVMAGDHIQSILQLAPWIDKVHGYPRFPKSPGLFWHVSFLKTLRAARYDAVINLNGSDRSAILTRLSGAPLRLGRVPPKVSSFWHRCFTHTVEVPFNGILYQQRWECLKQVGFPGDVPRFEATLPERIESCLQKLCKAGQKYLHLSPFTTQDTKELPEQVLVESINTLQDKGYTLAISCAPNDRELSKLKSLLARLKQQPWQVFDGSLTLLELAGVIQRADLHLGGDSGALHVALMTGTPTVSWWRDYKGREEWMPVGARHTALIGHESHNGLQEISASRIANEVGLLATP